MLETVILLTIGVVCGAVLGFWLGRLSAKYYVGETGSDGRMEPEGPVEESENRIISHTAEQEFGVGQPESVGEKHSGPGRLWYDRRKLSEAGVIIICSPVTGVVTDYSDGKRPQMMLYSTEEKLYAPAGGKVIRLFPLGNEILFRTEEGLVLRIKVGEGADELQSEYFRPKVIQNEVVNKGKLLLEFDRISLEAEGVECNISLRVEETDFGDKVSSIAEGDVKAGEGIFEILRK